MALYVINFDVAKLKNTNQTMGKEDSGKMRRFKESQNSELGRYMKLGEDNSPSDIRNDIILTDVETHGGDGGAKKFPSKAFVFVIKGT